MTSDQPNRHDPDTAWHRRARAFGAGVIGFGLLMMAVAAWAYSVAPEGATIRLPTRTGTSGEVGLGALFIYPALIMVLGLSGIVAPQKGGTRGATVWLIIATVILTVLEVVFIVDALYG